MDPRALFGLSIAMSLASSLVVAKLYVWPKVASMERAHALKLLIAPHLFLRFIGLSFLVPGVVSPDLPAALAGPAAFGDFITGILAIVATIGLARRTEWANSSVWLFNTFGAADFLFAFVQGARTQLDPGALGAAFFIPTAIVPPMLVIHGLIFRLLATSRVRRPTELRI